jgi:hypothetical protein
MPHPAGIISYVPQAKFWFPRSYVTFLKVHTNHVNSVSYSDGLITWGHIPPDAVSGQTKIRDQIIPWSSNTYSLSYVVEWWFYVISPSPIEIEWGGEVSFAYDDFIQADCLIIATEAGDTDYYYALPAAPDGYWPALPHRPP